MAHVISFRTSKFDISQERPNPVNPIAGQSVLSWLRGELEQAGYRSTEPDTEDWGWYMDVEGSGGSYLVGASADATDTDAAVEWTVQVHKSRSMKDKLFGGNKMTPDDPLSSAIERIIRADAGIDSVSVDREA